MRFPLTRTFLGAAGGLLLVVGVGILFQPQDFSAANGVILGDDPSHLSEVRAPGGLLIASAVFMLCSVGRDRLIPAALTLSAAVYGTYGLSRIVGMAFDGVPSDPLVQAMYMELMIGGLSVIALRRYLNHESAASPSSPKTQGTS